MATSSTPPIDDDRVQLLTTAEVAALVRSPQSTVRYWRHLGTGPHSFRLGRRVVYRRAEVLRWLDERELAESSVTG